MKKINQLIARSAFQNENQETIKAAVVIATAAKVLKQELTLSSFDAEVVVYRRQEIIIQVRHGSISGLIMMHQKKLLETINLAINRVYPQQPIHISRIITRQI